LAARSHKQVEVRASIRVRLLGAGYLLKFDVAFLVDLYPKDYELVRG
jgi:hypothetical protein